MVDELTKLTLNTRQSRLYNCWSHTNKILKTLAKSNLFLINYFNEMRKRSIIDEFEQLKMAKLLE